VGEFDDNNDEMSPDELAPELSNALRERRRLQRHQPTYPPLPADATPEKYLQDREAFQSPAINDEFGTTVTAKGSVSLSIIARARAMNAVYGVDAKIPCGYCRKQKTRCRIVHPDMYTAARHVVNKWWRAGRQKCAHCVRNNCRDCDAE
jgi:hypothetical protein